MVKILSYIVPVTAVLLSPFPWSRMLASGTDVGLGSQAAEKFSTEATTSTTTNATPQQSADEPRNPSGVGDFIYVVAGAVLAVTVTILATIIIVWMWRKRRSKSTTDHMRRNQLIRDEQEFKYGKPLNEGPEYSAPLDSTTKLLLVPYDTKLEIPRMNVNLSNATLLGTGNFGKVLKGQIGNRPVAVKMLLPNPDYLHFKAMLSELKMMSFVGEHENIVKLIAACTDHMSFKKMDILLIFEFCELGNTHSFIKERRDSFVNMKQDDHYVRDYNSINTEYSNAITEKLNSEQLLRWCFEVASGMEHLATKNIYHGDIAARNILLDGKFTAKIGDFGLSRQMYDYSVYVQSKECPLPLKWMALESLRDLEFSIFSDVWSYGIMMWEFFSLATIPYPGIDWNFEAWKYLSAGNRMECPDHAIPSVYFIMLQCWQAEPGDRPTFSQLKELLELELERIG